MKKIYLFIWVVLLIASGVLIGYSWHAFGLKAVAVGIVLFLAGILAGISYERHRRKSIERSEY